MKKIPLTQGQFALVDDEDFERLSKYKWTAKWKAGTGSFYAARGFSANGRKCTAYMHRETIQTTSGFHVDHVNHDTLDNRKENLRLCSFSGNQANQSIVKRNTSGFKGVSWSRENKKWRASIKVNLKARYLGFFDSATDAARAHDMAAVEAFGEFALTNKMMGLVS